MQGNMKKKQEPNLLFWHFFPYSFVCCMNKMQFQSKKQFGLLSGGQFAEIILAWILLF